jgi:hypothetical protein
MVVSDTSDWADMIILALSVSGRESVGLNAVELVRDTYRVVPELREPGLSREGSIFHLGEEEVGWPVIGQCPSHRAAPVDLPVPEGEHKPRSAAAAAPACGRGLRAGGARRR